MKQYKVTGMSCAACSARVEKAVSSVDGVESCNVNLLTATLSVEGDVSDKDIAASVKNAGYGIADDSAVKEESETKKLVKRLVSSVVFLLLLMYISMGHVMWGFPFFKVSPLVIAVFELVLTVIVMVINRKFFISGIKSALHLSPNMDTLVAMGSGAAFIYSVIMLVDIASGDHHALHELYFESAAMILTLITVGKMLESVSKGRTTNALKSLIKLAPTTATLIRDDREVTVDITEVKVGDIFVVRAGDRIATDGVVIKGDISVNESALTGESIPVDKKADDRVYGATVNLSGYALCRAEKVGEDTTLSKIIKTVTDASATKAPIARIADKVSAVFVPSVIAIALITCLGWLAADADIGFALERAISVLVISCPCALGLATPVAIMVGSGVGAKRGILYKSARALEHAGRVKTVALDKTGTVTEGKPRVTDLVPYSPDLLTIAASLEKYSEHPLAKAVTEFAGSRNVVLSDVENFTTHAGSGVSGVINGKAVMGGNPEYISQFAEITDDVNKKLDSLAIEGKTPMLFVVENTLAGIIAVADTVKKDSALAIKQFKKAGIRVVMLTGDNELTANAIAKQVGIDDVVANVKPDEKYQQIETLKQQGICAMVGDGINDAPALTGADVGIAIGAGTDIAIESADIVITKSRLTDAVDAITLSRATLKNIRQNLFWAFLYNCIGIPLAAGVFGWQIKPMFGAFAMSISSFCVITNALRLNLYKKGKKKMNKTVRIEGMMCKHCEMSVKNALEALPEVVSAEVSHEKGTAVIDLAMDLDDGVIKSTIENAGFKVI